MALPFSASHPRGVSDSVLRLVLAHLVGGQAQIWVQEEAGSVRSAVALLPPMSGAEPRSIAWDITLQLGIRPTQEVERMLDGQLRHAWLMLPLRHPHPQDLCGLLPPALAVVDARREAVVACVLAEDPSVGAHLTTWGFAATSSSALLRRPAPARATHRTVPALSPRR